MTEPADSPFKPWIEALPAFAGLPTADALAREGKLADAALLHLNESPFAPSPKVIAALGVAAALANRYAESTPARLAARLAAKFGVEPARLVVGAGSEELLQAAVLAAVQPGDNVVFPAPSFPRYRTATRIVGAEPRPVPLLAGGRNDVEGLLARIDARTRVVFACTPNNPSGAALPPEEIRRLVTGTPRDVVLVVDEAYAEFDAHEGGDGALGALRDRAAPWFSMRTFSKAYALAGLRVGYAIASDAHAAGALLKVKMSFNLTPLSIAGAEAALDDEPYSASLVARTVAERERLAAGLRRLGFPPLASRTNFLSIDCGRPAAPVIAGLAARGVFVRDWRDPAYDRHLRVTVGAPAENERFLAALAELNAPEPVR
jgi:histidinol-phosphate aminotransferase